MTQQRDSLQLRYQAALQDEEQNRPFFENFPALKKSKTLARGKIEQALNEVNGELDQLRAKLEEHNRQYASVLDQNTARVGAEEKNQIIAQRKQITTLESQLHHCDDDLRSKAKTLKSQTAWLQDIQSRQNEAEDKITKLHMGLENDSGSHQLPRINKIDANAKTVSKELQNLRGIVEKLRDDSLDFKDFQRGFHGTDFEKTYDRARDATKDIDFLNRDVTQLKNDLQRFREARTRNNDELETLRNDVKKLQKAASMPQEDEKQRTSGIKQIEDINKSVRGQCAMPLGCNASLMIVEHTSQIENLSRRLSKAEPRDTGVDVRDGKSRDLEMSKAKIVDFAPETFVNATTIFTKADRLLADVKGLEDKLAAVEQIIAAMPKTSDEHATEIDKSNSLSDFVTVQHLQGVTEELKKELDSGVEGRLRDLEQKFKQSTSDYVTKQESKTLDERLRKAEQCLVHIYAQHSNSPPANGGASDSARSHTTGTPPGLQEAQASIYQAHQHIGILTNRLNQYDRRLEDNTRSIEPLRVAIQHLETRHQNLTTETLSKLLINETSRMFPDARYLQQTANRCHAQWQTTKELSETVGSLRQTVEVGNANGMGKNYTLTLKSHETRLVELTKAHDDVLQRVERDHEELVRKMNGLEDAPGLIAGHTESLASVKSELEECRALVQKAQLDTRTVEGRFGAHVERMVKITSAIELLNRKNDLPAFEELL